jgi:hypothetical protein
MIPSELLQLVTQFGSWIIFGYLYFAERKRNSQVQEARIAELKAVNEFLVALVMETKGFKLPPIFPPEHIPP